MVDEIQSAESEINEAVSKNCTPSLQASHATLMEGKKMIGSTVHDVYSFYVACNFAVALVGSVDKISLATRTPQVNILHQYAAIGRDTAE